jgi:hypothetical protein
VTKNSKFFLPTIATKWTCLKTFYFYISNITKFGLIYLWMISTNWTTWQNWKKKHQQRIIIMFLKKTLKIKYNHFWAMASLKISFLIVDLYFIQVLEDNLWTFRNESDRVNNFLNFWCFVQIIFLKIQYFQKII